MTAQNINSLLNPKSVAITGASSNPEDLGSYVLKNIIFSNYKGKIYPISQVLTELYDLDTYPSIKDVKEDVDLVIISGESDRVIDDVNECTRANVKNICIVSSGFAETGSNGYLLQKKIVKMANEAGINVLGPNSLGVISQEASLNATFGPSMPLNGNASFISQSGALINSLIEYSKVYSLGLANIIGLGNKADVNEIDFIEYYSRLSKEKQPSALGCYLENISNGKEFLEVAPKLTRYTPLIVLIPSESPKTFEYIYSHTGSVIQKDAVLDLALSQTGAIKVYSEEQLYDLMLAFSWQMIPKGKNVAVVSNAGGGLILAIEQIYRSGLKMVNFSIEVKKMLTEELDSKECEGGVVDLGGEALSLNYLKVLDIILGDREVNSVIVILSPQIMTQIERSAEVIGKLAREHKKTVLAAFMGYEKIENGIKSLSKYFIPAFNTVGRAVYVLSKMYEFGRWQDLGGDPLTKFAYLKPIEKDRSIDILEIIEKKRVDKKLELNLDECIEVLSNYEIDLNNTKRIKNLKDILTFGKKNKYPLEFYCIGNKKGRIVYREDQMKALYKSHFEKQEYSDTHKFRDHIIKRVFENKKNFWINIQKDTYYEHIEKGLNLKELEKLSFGYIFELKTGSLNGNHSIKALIPFSRSTIVNEIENANFFKKLDVKLDKRYLILKDELIVLIRKLCKIPIDFPQIHAISVNCIIDKNDICIVNARIKLDLMI